MLLTECEEQKVSVTANNVGYSLDLYIILIKKFLSLRAEAWSESS